MQERSGHPYRICGGERPVKLGVFRYSRRSRSNSSQSILPEGAVLRIRCFTDFMAASV